MNIMQREAVTTVMRLAVTADVIGFRVWMGTAVHTPLDAVDLGEVLSGCINSASILNGQTPITVVGETPYSSHVVSSSLDSSSRRYRNGYLADVWKPSNPTPQQAWDVGLTFFWTLNGTLEHGPKPAADIAAKVLDLYLSAISET